MLKRLALVTVAVALAVPATANAEVTIKVGDTGGQQDKYRETLYPNGFRVKGKTGSYRGPVTLEVDGFPYEGTYSNYGPSVSTNDKGEYVFPDVVLGRNAKVRAVAGSERSKAIELFVHPGVRNRFKELSRDRMRIDFTYIGHPGFAPPPNAFYVYIVFENRSGMRRFHGPATMQKIADGTWRYRKVLDEPVTRRATRYYVLYCTRGLSAAGYGRFWPIDVGCGKKVIKG